MAVDKNDWLLAPFWDRVNSCRSTSRPVNMPDSIRNRFVYFHLWPLRLACSQNRPGSYMPDPTYASISFPFFQRRHASYCVKPTQIRSGWPSQGLAKHVWCRRRLVCWNHRARSLVERNRPATSFTVSYSVPFFHRRPG